MNKEKINSSVLERIKKIPIFDTLGFDIKELNGGVCVTYVPRQKQYDGIFETFHGGLLMTVADSIAAFAILTETGAESRITTTDMNIRFLAPCRTGVRAEAKIIKLGKTLCPVAIDLFDYDGIKVAIAQVNYIILK